jgi:hypothetical protein
MGSNGFAESRLDTATRPRIIGAPKFSYPDPEKARHRQHLTRRAASPVRTAPRALGAQRTPFDAEQPLAPMCADGFSERAGKSRREPAPQCSLFTDGALPLTAFPKRKHTPLRRDRFGLCESTTRNLRLPALQSGELASLFADASESGGGDAGRGGSSASLNLVCDLCGHKFFSAAAQDMIGKTCPQTGCGGALRPLGRKLR